MEKRYAAYIDGYQLSTKPMSFEEFAQYTEEQDAKVAIQKSEVEKVIAEVTKLYIYEEPTNRMEAQMIVRRLQNEMKQNVIGADKYTIIAHNQAVKEISAKLAAIFNRQQRTTVAPAATFVYDNDNRPTSH